MSDIIVINPRPYKEELLPEIGKIYYVYDDGKIRISREHKVKIEAVIPFKKANRTLKSSFKYDAKTIYWLFDTKTDYFIHAIDIETDDPSQNSCWFARTRDGGWFCLSNSTTWFCGRLDICGDLYKIAHEN